MLQLSCSPSVLLLKRQLLVCPGKKKKITVLSPAEMALGRWGAGNPSSSTLGCYLPAFGKASVGLKNTPRVLPKLSLFTVHLIRWLFMGKLRKTVPAKARLASGEVNGKFQGSQEAQVGSETGRGWGGSLPCTPQPQDPMAGKAWEQADTLPSWAQGYPTQIPHQGERASLC